MNELFNKKGNNHTGVPGGIVKLNGGSSALANIWDATESGIDTNPR